MNWPLIAAGVMAGLGLVIAKQWFSRGERKAIRRHQGVESASADGEQPAQEESAQTSAVADAVSPAPDDTPAAGSEPSPEATPETQAGPGDAGLEAKASQKDSSDEKRVEEALASGDLSVMESVLRESDNPIHRNLLLDRLAAGHYRLRSEPEHREAFYRVARTQIDEVSAILNAFDEMGKPRPGHIEAFKSIAIALGEDERYDEAMAVCEKALLLGLGDGTKTGFKGRIARLKKSRDSG